MKVLLLLVLVVSVLAILPRSKIHNRYSKKDDAEIMFAAWKIKYNKTYVTDDEETLRFANFKVSMDRIQSRNSKTQSNVFGLTKYSDLTPQEFKRYLGYVPKNIDDDVSLLPSRVYQAAAPQQFDWRDQKKVTDVKDQGQCGSCWAFSVVENIESIWMIAKGITADQMQILSEQEVVDCDTQDAGCEGGDPPTAYAYIMSAGGLEKESDYPYSASDGTCSFDKSKVYATISNWRYATKSQDEGAMQNALYGWGPLSICVDAEPWQDYSSGIMMASDCSTTLDHCVQAVGYDLTGSTPFWIVRNSWGTDWGENGYIRLQYGQDTCGCADEATSSCVNKCN